MSININGNKVKKFGKYLPTIYMDEIQVYADQITVLASCYFLRPQNTFDSAFEDFRTDILKNLFWTVILLPDGATHSPDIPESEYPADNFNNIFQGDSEFTGLNIEKRLKEDVANVFELIRHANMATRGGSMLEAPIFSTTSGMTVYFPDTSTDFAGLWYIKGSDADQGFDIMYDDFGNEVIRQRLKTTFSISTDSLREYDPAISVSSTAGNRLYIESMLGGEQFNMVSFSTTLEMDDTDFYNTYTRDAAQIKKNLYLKYISDITYETVSSGGLLSSVARPVYTLTDTGQVYLTGEVLQAFDSLYYSDEGINNQGIIEVFNGLIEQAMNDMSVDTATPTTADTSAGFPGVDTSEDALLQDAIDNLKLILIKNAGAIDLVPKLRLYEKTFPSTSTITPVGAFYERYQIALYNVNNAIKRGTQLTKSMNLNTIVKDYVTKTGFDVSGLLTARPEDIGGAYLMSHSSLPEEGLAAGSDPEENEIRGPAYYTCYADPTNIEFFPLDAIDEPVSGGSEAYSEFAKFLQRFNMTLDEFKAIDFKDIEKAAEAMILVFTGDVRVGNNSVLRAHGGRGEAVDADTPYSSMHAMTFSGFAEQFLNCLGKCYAVENLIVGSTEDIARLVQEFPMRLLHDTFYLTSHDTAEHFRYPFKPRQQLFYGDSEIDYYTHSAITYETSTELNNVRVLFNADKKVHEEFNGTFGGDYDGGLIDVLEEYLDFRGFNTDYADLARKFAKQYSEMIIEPFKSQFNPDTGVEPFSGATDGTGSSVMRYENAINAIQNENSVLCEVYGFAILYYFLKNLNELGGEYIVTESNQYLHGIFWFDWGKAYRNRSIVSHIYDVGLLEAYFGSKLSNKYYKVKRVNCRRYHSKRSSTDRQLSYNLPNKPERVAPTVNYIEGVGDQEYEYVGMVEAVMNSDGYRVETCRVLSVATSEDPLPSMYSTVEDEGDVYVASTPMIGKVTQEVRSVSEDEETTYVDLSTFYGDQYTFIANRAVAFPINEGTYDPSSDRIARIRDWYATTDHPGTKIMCFQHQEVAGPFGEENPGLQGKSTEFPYSLLHHEVEVEDFTAKIAFYIIESFMSYYSTFQNYIDLASEECNYNTYDSAFNDEFVEAILAEYETRPDLSPWFKMPVIYHMHLDLLYGVYSGNRTALFDAALRDSEKISPTSGTLSEMLNFSSKVNKLINDQYLGATAADEVVPNSVNYRLDRAGYPIFATVNDLNTSAFVKMAVFQNGGDFGSTVDPKDCEVMKYIPAPINVVNYVADLAPPPVDLLTDCADKINRYAEHLTKYYTLPGHNLKVRETWASTTFDLEDTPSDPRESGDDPSHYLWEHLVEFFDFTDIIGDTMSGIYTFDSEAGTFDEDLMEYYAFAASGEAYPDEGGMVSYGADVDGFPLFGSRDRWLYMTTAKVFVNQAFGFIRSAFLDHSIELSKSEEIDLVHQHALLRVRGEDLSEIHSSGATMLDISDFDGYYGDESKVIRAISKAKHDLAQFFFNNLTSAGQTLVNLIRSESYNGSMAAATADDITGEALKNYPYMYYMDYTTFCDDLIGTIIGTLCIMVKRTEQYTRYGNMPVGTDIDDLYDILLPGGKNLEDYIIDRLQSRKSTMATKEVRARNTGASVAIAARDHSYTGIYAQEIPERTMIFKGVSGFAGGGSTIQYGFDYRDDLVTDIVDID